MQKNFTFGGKPIKKPKFLFQLFLSGKLEQSACPVKEGADPEDQQQVVQGPTFRGREKAGEKAEVLHVPLFPEEGDEVAAETIDGRR